MTSYNAPLPLAQLSLSVPITLTGATVAVNNLGTGSVQVIAADQNRKTIYFHNPNVAGQVNVLVCQALDINGNALTASFSTPGGGWVILPGDTLAITGDVQGAWLATAQSGTTNGLTVFSSRS
jgi:hypothetical protein